MENPDTWGPAEKLIQDIIRQHQIAQSGGLGYIGLSLSRKIADALREAGLLQDAP